MTLLCKAIPGGPYAHHCVYSCKVNYRRVRILLTTSVSAREDSKKRSDTGYPAVRKLTAGRASSAKTFDMPNNAHVIVFSDAGSRIALRNVGINPHISITRTRLKDI